MGLSPFFFGGGDFFILFGLGCGGFTLISQGFFGVRSLYLFNIHTIIHTFFFTVGKCKCWCAFLFWGYQTVG